MSCQLDVQVMAKMHGLRDVFRPDRVLTTLDTIKGTCVAATKFGTVLYATSEGTAAQGGSEIMPSYPATETFMQAIVPLGLMFMYARQIDFGLEIILMGFLYNVLLHGI